MRHSAATSLFVWAILSLSGCGTQQLKEVTSVEGKYKVLMPGNPKESPDLVGKGKVNLSVLPDGALYGVSFMELGIPPDEPQEERQARLDAAIKDSRAAKEGSVKRSEKITLAGQHPGWDLEGDLPKKNWKYRARIYLVATRLYKVEVFGPQSVTSSATADRFLDSFTLLP